MITGTLDDYKQYVDLHAGFDKAFAYLEQCCANAPLTGTHFIDGTAVYAIVQEYITANADNFLWEAHRQYIDIQCIMEGDECIGYTKLSNLIDMSPYDNVQDCILCEKVISKTSIHLHKHQFAILFPEDAHKPKCQFDYPSLVRKIVVKVAI